MINKDNRDGGFSLVELVITILIMAIVAAALSPQVMKWVNNARISQDLQTRNTMESNARYATSDPAAYEEIASRQIKITITEDGCVMTDTGSEDPFPNFAAALASYFGKAVSVEGSGYKLAGVKLKTSGGEVNVFVTRGAVSSIINQALASDDLQVSTSDVVVPELWSNSVLTTQVGSATGTISFTSLPSGSKPTNPAFRFVHEWQEKGSNLYLDDILVIADASLMHNVKTVAPAPNWVFVGPADEIKAGNYSNVLLYQWSGATDGDGNPIWKILAVNGL